MIPKKDVVAQDRRERILIVDDEERLRNILMNYLETEGSDCETSDDALDALEKLRSGRFSLIDYSQTESPCTTPGSSL